MKRIVYHHLSDLEGNPVVGAVVVFKLESGGYTSEEMYIKSEVIAVSDNEGKVEAELWVNGEAESEACYSVTLPDCNTFEFVIPAGTEPISLITLRQAGKSWSDPTFLPTIEYIRENAAELGLNVILEKSYVHHQDAIATYWFVNHRLGKKPSVEVEDQEGNPLEAYVSYQGFDDLTVQVSPPTAGKASCN